MKHQTINMQKAVDLFEQLILPVASFRVLQLRGEGKMGKTHLVTKVFPALVQQIQAHCAISDLRGEDSILNVLHNKYSMLSNCISFDEYPSAHKELLDRTQLSVSNLRLFLSRVNMVTSSEDREDKRTIQHLTASFIADLRKSSSEPVILLFDQIDDAEEVVRDWLMRTLVVQLVQIPQIRVVLAGRTLPEARSSYAALCKSHLLLPIEEIDDYLTYCQLCHNVSPPMDHVKLLVDCSAGIPGQFVEGLQNYIERRN